MRNGSSKSCSAPDEFIHALSECLLAEDGRVVCVEPVSVPLGIQSSRRRVHFLVSDWSESEPVPLLTRGFSNPGVRIAEFLDVHRLYFLASLHIVSRDLSERAD